MVFTLTITRIALIVISIVLIVVMTKLRKDGRVGNSFFIIIILFWLAVFGTAFRPQTLDEIVNYTGLYNKAQLLLILSVGIILYLLAMQVVKNNNVTFNLSKIVREIALSSFRDEINGSMQHPDVIIVIAAKNESKSIGAVIDKINHLKVSFSYKIIVVNDGSDDNTESIARSKGALVVNHYYNLGLGGAIKTGYLASTLFKPSIIVTIDADGQHDPKYITEIVSKIKNEQADLVYASRFSDKSKYATSAVRSVGNRFYTRLVRRIAKISITDVTTGYRGIKFDKLKEIFFVSESNFAIELAIRAGKNGLKVSEIPIAATERESGKSQFHKIERFIVYNINAMRQIFNSYFTKPGFEAYIDRMEKQ